MIERLEYDPATGIFRWRFLSGRGARNDLAGQIAGSPHVDGYVAIQIGRKKYMAHRLAWFFSKGEWPNGDIDHLNGVRTDNRLSNLRDATKSINAQNRRPGEKSLGIDFCKIRGAWRTRITSRGVTQALGFFKCERDAQTAYLAAKREIHEGCTI